MKKILFIIDKIELKYFEYNKLVTNFWLIKEFLDRDVAVYISTIPLLSLKNKTAFAKCYKSYIKNEDIFYEKTLIEIEIDNFDIVMFRPDPPVDIDYINATYIFDFVKTKIINSPKAIRSFNEKLHSLYFQEYMTNCLVTSQKADILEFLNKYKQIILKPLNKCFGAGVMYLYLGDPNTTTIVNSMTNNETSVVMVQEFLPEVKNGDTRVLTLGDKILPYCIKKLPGKNDFKFNTHNDNFLVRSDLSKEQLESFTPVAKRLNDTGIYLAGFDVVGDKIIEINVTSPCYFIKEINELYNIHLEKDLANYLLTQTLLSL